MLFLNYSKKGYRKMKASTILRIGDVIRTLRENKGWTQQRLSEVSGIHEVQIRRYENNQALPRDAQLAKLAAAFNVNKDYFFNQQLFSEASKMDEDIKKQPFKPIKLGQDTLSKPFTTSVENPKQFSINTDNIDKTHPINTILTKVDNHEQLTPEELEQYRNHVAKAIPSIKQSLESFAETLKQSLAEYYEVMNDEGQKEADLQIQKTIEKVTKQAENQAIDEATEKVQLLSRIPEYKKDSDA